MSILITGSPGVGKHAVAAQISDRMGLDLVDINQVASSSGIIENAGDVDTERLSGIICKMIHENSIIVGHLAPYVLDEAQIKIAVVLRRNPYDLIRVYKERGYTEEKSRQNAGSEILGIIMHDTIDKFGAKTVQINAGNKGITDAANRTESAVNGDNVGDMVDWLGLVVRNGDLKKFFDD